MWFPPPTFWLSWIILHKYSCTCFYVDCVLDAEIILWIPGAIDRGHRCPPGTGGWESHRSPFSGPVGCHCSELSHVLTVTWQAWQHVKPNLGFSPPPPARACGHPLAFLCINKCSGLQQHLTSTMDSQTASLSLSRTAVQCCLLKSFSSPPTEGEHFQENLSTTWAIHLKTKPRRCWALFCLLHPHASVWPGVDYKI